jgi:subtilase-type serine protease
MFQFIAPPVRPHRPTWKTLLLCSAALLPMIGGAAQAGDGTLRILTLNIWNKFKNNPEYASDFFIGGDWDTLLFQEESGSRYVQNIPGILAGAGLGTYQGARNGSSGIISRLPGTTGTYTATGAGAQGRNITYALANADDGRPATYIASVHLDYSDQPTQRINEARHLIDWSKTLGGPLILAGDFNAGDVSERGLHSKAQQEFFLRLYTKNPTNTFYYSLLSQYATDKTALDKFIADWRGTGGTAIDAAPIPSGLFVDETYAIAGNTPRTMNLLKKQFIVMQTEADREDFFPHELNDGSGTWPSAGEDDTNTWGSWHRVKIDHFLASRPFGKWYAIVDDPDDPYLGVIKDVYATTPGGEIPISDHEPVAHEFGWVGPKLETYTEDVGGTVVNKTRLVWAEDATIFDETDKTFFLTRNNMRTDVYLGQIADDNGNPILTDLTLEEKKTLLDCTSDDPRFAAAIVEYCIDDHSFIGETLVTDGGTVIVEEDAALGLSSAQLRLDDGGLRVRGTDMTTLGRDVSLEGLGGFIEISDADAAVTASGVFSGVGDFEKRGAGHLNLTGTSTYTGETLVSDGLLSVNGSIADSALTTVADGGTLGGSGTVGNLTIASGGTLAPGNSIGTLNVDGDLVFEDGSVFRVEADADGNSDKVVATGTATLAGSVVSIAAGGAWRADNEYVILSAAGGILGRFDDEVDTNLVFLTPTLSYDGTDVLLHLDRNDTAFDGIASSANRRSVAAAIDALGAGNPVYGEIVLTDIDTANAAFTDLSGELHATALGGFIENAMVLNGIVAGRMSGVVDIGADTAAAGEGELWLKAYGGWGRNSGGDVSGAERNTANTLLGYDVEVGDGWRAGVFGGFGQSSLALDDTGASLSSDAFHFGAYASGDAGPVTLSLGGAYSRNDVDSRRYVTYGSIDETLTADYGIDVLQLFGEASHRFETEYGTFAPFLGLAHVRASTGGFTEEGGDAALSSDGDLVAATFATLGLRTEQALDLGGVATTFRGEVGLRHAFGDVDPTVELAIGGSGFAVTGAPLSRNSAVVSAALDFELAPQSSFSLGYSGQFGADAMSQNVSAALKVRF